jgi:flagellar basal-body rod protein FlgC
MTFLPSLDIIGSALTAERYRTDVILQNISNARTTRTAGGGPYRRQQLVFEEKPFSHDGTSFSQILRHQCRFRHNQTAHTGGVKVQTMVDSINELRPVYDPNHPDADTDGYVWYPNVDTTEEMVDLMAATNSYDANLTAMSVVKAMITKSLDLGK